MANNYKIHAADCFRFLTFVTQITIALLMLFQARLVQRIRGNILP